MLANKNTQDPSCSSKLSVLQGCESAPDKVPFQERDLTLEVETPAPNFSIRDYVLASRAKGIEANWPFKKHLLKLFLKHGIKDPLPPFEPPGLVRLQCERKGIEPVYPVICSEVEEITANVDPQANVASIRRDSCPLLETLTLDEKLITCQRISKNETVHLDANIGLLSTHDQVGGNSTDIGSRPSSLSKYRGPSEALSEIEIRKTAKSVNQSSCKPSEKKCRLIVKLGGISKNSRAEDKTSNSSIVSDPMASKVCPVCKTFSSTSNTTLNAHIDQCLSMESYNKCTSSEFLQPQVKPEKKRLMVDIYATAPLCTLEDLDRRNGTNWATDLAYLVSPIREVGRDEKKLKLVTVDSRGNENAAVYVDSSGIKLGIVSKLNGSPQLKDELKLQKHERIIEISKNVVMSKKKKSANYLKMKRENLEKKKLIPFRVSKSQIQTESRGDRNSETHHEHGESQSYVTEPGNLAKSNKSASSKQWISSSQSNLLRNLDSKNDHSAADTARLTRSRLAESSLSNVCSSSVSTSHRLKISRLSQGSISSLKSNKIEFITKTVHSLDYAMRKSKKLPISTSRWPYGNVSENGIRRKANDFDQGIQQWFTNSCDPTNIPSEICHSMKNGTVTSLKKNNSVRRRSFSIGARTCNLSEDPSTSSTFRKHRSLCRSRKYRAQFSAEFPRASERLSSEIDHSNIVTLSCEGVHANHSLQLIKDVSGFEKRDDRSTIMEEQKHLNLKRLSITAEYNDHDVENLEMQVEGSGIYVKKSTTEISGVSHPTKIDSLFKPSMVEHSQSISESDAREEQIIKMSEKQVVFSNDASKEGIDERGIANDEESWDKDFLVAPAECEVKEVAVQESSDCLTSHRDVQLDMNSDSDGEPCGSVISTTSSISLPSPRDPKDTDVANEQLASAIISQDNLCLSVPIAEDDIETEERNVMISNQDLNIKQPAEVLHHSLNDKPFCCSCRENISRDSTILGPSIAYGSGNGKQASNLFTRRSVCSSSSSYQNRVTDDMMNSDLQAAALSTFNKGLLTSSGNVPACSASGSATPSQSQNQSISNPILRLMGKNLMVMNNQEVVQPSGEHPPNKTLWSPLEFTSTSNHMKLENFQYHAYSLGRPPVFDQTVTMVGPSHNATCFVPRPNHHARQKNAFMNEGILADDSSETENELKASLHIPIISALPFPASGSNLSAQQTFSHLSSQCHTSDLPREPRPLLQNPYISANASLMGRGSASECHGPDHFVFQSPSIGHMLSSVCCSQLRWPAN